MIMQRRLCRNTHDTKIRFPIQQVCVQFILLVLAQALAQEDRKHADDFVYTVYSAPVVADWQSLTGGYSVKEFPLLTNPKFSTSKLSMMRIMHFPLMACTVTEQQ